MAGPDQVAFADICISSSFSIRTFAAGPDEAGFWPLINWPSVTV